MKETIERILGVKCGMVGDGICDIVDGINICTIWTAAQAFGEKIEITDNDLTSDSSKKYKDVSKKKIQRMVKEAELFILDECQYAAAKSLQFVHRISTNARYRFLLSGTPWREAGDDILIEAVSGPKFYDLPASKLIDDGVLVPPKIYFINVPKMKFLNGTYQSIYDNYIVKNTTRNSLIVDAAKKLVQNGRRVLILISKVEHGKILYDTLSQEFSVDSLNGTTSSEARMNAIDSIRKGKIDILIASKIFDQGIDIPELDALILAGSGKSSARALQRIGRVIRPSEGKKWANVIEFMDNAKYLESHSKARLKIYQSEPGFQIKVEERNMVEEVAAQDAKPKRSNRRRVLQSDTPMDWCE
jgi:superfamily II DNA or RNA helicase